MITTKDSYLMVGENFKKVSNILYDDLVYIANENYLVNGFDPIQECIEVKTSFNTIYLRDNQSLFFRDFLSGSFEKKSVQDLYQEDELFFPKINSNYLSEKFDFQDFLYLDKYDYSIGFPDIVNKYKLPKEFLYKALTTGCPDDEFPQAKEYNDKLKRILGDLKIDSEQELKIKLLDQYSNLIPSVKKKASITKAMLDLMYLCITNNYTLLTHTSLNLYIQDSEVFARVLSFLTKYNINKTITNSIYNKRDCSVISINSSLVYNLFRNEFNNYNFILKLSKKDSEYLLSKLDDDFYSFNSKLSGQYVHEFLYRHSSLYFLDSFDNSLSKVNRFKIVDNGFLVPVISITKRSSSNFINISLNPNA